MARTAKLVPHYDKTRGQWVLNVPGKLSPTGARQRLYYDRGKEEEAKEHARRLREGKEHFKERAKGIRPDLMEAAVKWEEAALEFGYRGLDHFCTEAFAKLEASSSSPTLGALLDAAETDHRSNWSDDYYSKRWKPFRSRLMDLEETRIAGMHEEFWREWLREWRKLTHPGPDTYNQHVGNLQSLFEQSAAKKVHPVNPLAAIPRTKDKSKRSKPVSSPPDVLKLLLAAWEHDREMVPYFATCYFAGLRPDSEAKRVRFEHFVWSENHLKVDISKTTHLPTRYVTIEDALREWMKPWMKKKGSIIPSNFTKRRRWLIYGYHTTPGATKGDPTRWKQLVAWGHDISRHSYGSYFEAAHRGEAGCREKIVANMGHRDFKTFDRYYLNARTREEGKAYWAIRPPES